MSKNNISYHKITIGLKNLAMFCRPVSLIPSSVSNGGNLKSVWAKAKFVNHLHKFKKKN